MEIIPIERYLGSLARYSTLKLHRKQHRSKNKPKLGSEWAMGAVAERLAKKLAKTC